MTGRAINWVGKHPDAAVPALVKARICLRQSGLCAITKVRLRPGHIEFDHKTPLSMGGAHDEANLQAITDEAHKVKTRAEAAPRAKADRIRAKHLGLKTPGSRWPSKCRGFDGRVKPTKRALRAMEGIEG